MASRLQALIDMAKPAPGVTEVLFTASDGYTNTIELDKVAAEGVIVAYGMNGEPLPQKHGYPARIITPGRYGEKHVKWVTRIELQNASHHRLLRVAGVGSRRGRQDALAH